MTISDDNSEGTPIFESTRQTTHQTSEPLAGDTQAYRGPAAAGGTTTTSSIPGAAGGDASKTDVAKDEAGRVADSAKDAAADVASVAKEEAHQVAHETKAQAKDLYRQTQQELREQAAIQQQRVADGLRSIGDELQQMASSSQQHGVASDIVGQAADRTQSVARWLDQRDPGSLLQEVKSYARRNPGTFIAAAALTGVLAGRLTRALASGDDGSSGATSSTTTPRSAAPLGTSPLPPVDAGAGAPTTALPTSGSAIPGGTWSGAAGGTTGGYDDDLRPGGSL